MNMQQHILARKYATAFLNVYEDFSEQEYRQLVDAVLFVKRKHHILTLLSLPTLSKIEKKECLERFFIASQMPPRIEPLATLLLNQQRIELLPSACQEIIRQYQERKKIMPFVIRSAESLHTDQLAVVTQFLAEKTGNRINYTTNIDPSLIAGIRMQSDTFLWEYSIMQQLRMLRKEPMR